MRYYPALDFTWPSAPTDDEMGCLLAELDAEGPTAVEERPSGLRVFFATAAARERAAVRVGAGAPVDVPDEDWAERSQAALGPVRVGDIVVAPPWWRPGPDIDARRRLATIVIQPSMGFGTGHHASTRLCLALLQREALAGRRVLDIGTGSGVLALAAWRLGADAVRAVDHDPDALTSARDSVQRNSAERAVAVEPGNLATLANPSGGFDVVLGNLTSALLVGHAAAIASLASSRGRLIVSGFQTEDAAAVRRAFGEAGCDQVDAVDEDDWVGLRLARRS